MKQRWDPWVKVETGLSPAGPSMGSLHPSAPVPVPLRVTVAPPVSDPKKLVRTLVVGVAFGLVAAYHGYRRNESKLWAIPWGFGGFICPLVTLPFAISQGYAKKEG